MCTWAPNREGFKVSKKKKKNENKSFIIYCKFRIGNSIGNNWQHLYILKSMPYSSKKCMSLLLSLIAWLGNGVGCLKKNQSIPITVQECRLYKLNILLTQSPTKKPVPFFFSRFSKKPKYFGHSTSLKCFINSAF